MVEMDVVVNTVHFMSICGIKIFLSAVHESIEAFLFSPLFFFFVGQMA